MLEKPPTDREWSMYIERVWSYLEHAADVDDVIHAYLNLQGRPAKARARNVLQDLVTDFVEAGKDDGAKRVVELRNRLKERQWGRNQATARADSRVERYLEHVGALQLAFGICATHIPPEVAGRLPEGWLADLPTDNTDAVRYREWLLDDPDTRGSEPAVREIDKRAARVSLGRAPGAAGRPPAIRRRRTEKTQKGTS